MGVVAAVVPEMSQREVSAAETGGCPISQSTNPSVLRIAVQEPMEITSLDQAPSWKGDEEDDDECLISSVTPGLIAEWIGGVCCAL